MYRRYGKCSSAWAKALCIAQDEALLEGSGKHALFLGEGYGSQAALFRYLGYHVHMNTLIKLNKAPLHRCLDYVPQAMAEAGWTSRQPTSPFLTLGLTDIGHPGFVEQTSYALLGSQLMSVVWCDAEYPKDSTFATLMSVVLGAIATAASTMSADGVFVMKWFPKIGEAQTMAVAGMLASCFATVYSVVPKASSCESGEAYAICRGVYHEACRDSHRAWHSQGLRSSLVFSVSSGSIRGIRSQSSFFGSFERESSYLKGACDEQLSLSDKVGSYLFQDAWSQSVLSLFGKKCATRGEAVWAVDRLAKWVAKISYDHWLSDQRESGETVSKVMEGMVSSNPKAAILPVIRRLLAAKLVIELADMMDHYRYHRVEEGRVVSYRESWYTSAGRSSMVRGEEVAEVRSDGESITYHHPRCTPKRVKLDLHIHVDSLLSSDGRRIWKAAAHLYSEGKDPEWVRALAQGPLAGARGDH